MVSKKIFFSLCLQVSWSKVVALFAFAARLAVFCREHESRIGADRVFDVAYVLAQFAVERLTPFLKRNGGWVRLLSNHVFQMAGFGIILDEVSKDAVLSDFLSISYIHF